MNLKAEHFIKVIINKTKKPQHKSWNSPLFLSSPSPPLDKLKLPDYTHSRELKPKLKWLSWINKWNFCNRVLAKINNNSLKFKDGGILLNHGSENNEIKNWVMADKFVDGRTKTSVFEKFPSILHVKKWILKVNFSEFLFLFFLKINRQYYN